MTDFTPPETPDTSRRRLLQAGAGAAALGLLPGLGMRNAHAQGAFDWKRFKGEKIEVFLVKSPRGDLLTKYHKEFEDLTGITVGSEMIPEQQQRQKAVIEFNSGNPSFDVIALSYHVQKRQFAQEQVADRRAPAASATSRWPTRISTSPISRRAASTTRSQPDGRVDSLPLNLDPWVVYYNKELFAAKGVAYPKTFAEMIDAAAKLNDPGKGVSGFVGARAQERQRAGVDELPARLRRRLHRRQGQADDRYARSDRSGEDVPDAAREVRPAGRRRLQLERVAEPVPAGQGGDVARRHRLRAAARGSDEVAHRRQGRLRRDAARARSSRSPRCSATAKASRRTARRRARRGIYLQWASNKANQTRMLQAAAGAPVRNSAYAAAQQSSDFKAPKEWVDCMLKSAAIAQPGLPVIVAGDRIPRRLRHRAHQHDQRRRSGDRTASKATAEFQPVLDKSEKA